MDKVYLFVSIFSQKTPDNNGLNFADTASAGSTLTGRGMGFGYTNKEPATVHTRFLFTLENLVAATVVFDCIQNADCYMAFS